MMLDHLLNFPDEVTAQADRVVGKYYTPPSDDGPGGWRGDCCFVVRVFQKTGTQEETREYFPGWQIWIALATLDETLRDLPDNACRIIADYDAYEGSDPNFIRYLARDFDQTTLSSWHIEPQPAREVGYPFGQVMQPTL